MVIDQVDAWGNVMGRRRVICALCDKPATTDAGGTYLCDTHKIAYLKQLTEMGWRSRRPRP